MEEARPTKGIKNACKIRTKGWFSLLLPWGEGGPRGREAGRCQFGRVSWKRDEPGMANCSTFEARQVMK